MVPLELLSQSVTSTVLLLISVALISVWYFYRRGPKHDLPPGPKGLPFIGVVRDLKGKNQFTVFSKWAEKYGDLVSYEVMGRRTVMINDFDLVREAFKQEVFSGRPQGPMLKLAKLGNGILLTEGDIWKEQRRFDLSVLRDFGMGKIKAEEAIQEELKHLISAIDEKNGEPFDFQPVMQMAVCNIIVSILFGKRYSYDNSRLLLLMRLITENVRNGAELRLTVLVAPWLRHLPGDMFGFWKFIKNNEATRSFIQEEINYHKSTYQPEETRDFVDAYLHRMEKEKDNVQTTFTDGVLQRTCVELFVAGMETTATTLRWAIVYLLNHPHIQQKIQTKIDREIGSETEPSMKHRVNLPYVEATINETFRYSCLVPGAVPHCNTEEVMLNGYRIPKRSNIFPNIPKIHFSPKYWKDPVKFEPDRFLDDSGHLMKKEQLMPFSVGKRSCLGESLAKMELFIFFTGLLQNFTFLPEIDGEPPSTEPLTGSVYSPKTFLVRAKKRI